MIRIRIICLLSLPLFIANACFAKDRVVAKYNGQNILKSEISERIKTLSGKLPEGKNDFDDYNAKIKTQLIGEFIQEKLLATCVETIKIDQNPAHKKQLENLIKQFKIRIYLEKYTKQKLTPLMIRVAYNKYIKAIKESDELKVSHILYKTEAEANKAAAEIKANKISFENAAKKYSIDKISKTKGGDLEFIHRGQTVPEFENTAYNLKDGSISAPVQTKFGWHIVKRFSSRKRKIPPFNEVKQSIEREVKMNLTQQHIDELTKAAKIEIFPENK